MTIGSATRERREKPVSRHLPFVIHKDSSWRSGVSIQSAVFAGFAEVDR